MSITIEKVSKSFGRDEVLRSLSLEIPTGSFTALLGPSGSGKSTLLRLIAGLTKVDSGRIWLNGVDVTDVPGVRAGDEVVLIRLQQGMQEATRTKTDTHGRFTLDVPDSGIHLVRVTHDKANYFRPAPPGTQSVEIDVYNAAVKVKGVGGEADVMRVQTDASGKALQVV